MNFTKNLPSPNHNLESSVENLTIQMGCLKKIKDSKFSRPESRSEVSRLSVLN